MTDDDQPEPERTIIRPAAGAKPPPSATASEPAPAAAEEAQRTIIQAAPGTTTGGMATMAPRVDGARIQVGDVLNHIFEVKRFLARGGMGEVFEGVNVNSDERVAIKVILPQLAADPNVQAMFRKEARTLTRLSHPALVQYRVLAQEPQLGVFYIVTEFIDGANLSDVLTQLKPTPADLVALTRRLAEGLSAAHALGAIHRDMSPDNVLLEDGRLDRARIIDFGIAKDLDPGSKTIIGDGFAGKLGYVAPEQLGDFDREVGPWSDVYSLGLLILAVAQGRNVDMGASFVEAIDRRRKGADTSAAPPEIRAVLDQMLTPNPAERLRSMEAVVAALATPAAAVAAGPAAASKAKPAAKPATSAAPAGGGNKALIFGGAGGLALLLAVGGYLAFGGSNATAPSSDPAVAGATAGPATAETVRIAVSGALPTLACTWLDLTNLQQSGGSVSMAFTGVAGRPAEAEAAISRAVTGTGAKIGATDFTDVAPIAGTECDSIDAFRQIRADPQANHLVSTQRKFEMKKMSQGDYAGQIGAQAVIEMTLGSDVQDFALYGLEPSGAISALIANRAAFDTIPKGEGSPIADLGNGRYRLTVDTNHSGWSGFLLLTGSGGFSDSLLVGNAGARPAGWRQQFEAAAAAGSWKAEMVWVKFVDEIKDAAAS